VWEARWYSRDEGRYYTIARKGTQEEAVAAATKAGFKPVVISPGLSGSGPDEAHVFSDRIGEALMKADLAFWAEIAKAFPEAKTGDFPPEASLKWDKARDQAVYWWLVFNHPNTKWIEKLYESQGG